MKKTNRNQNMPDQKLRNNGSANTASLNSGNTLGKPERYSDPNLHQPVRKMKQRYDDYTGTVENGFD